MDAVNTSKPVLGLYQAQVTMGRGDGRETTEYFFPATSEDDARIILEEGVSKLAKKDGCWHHINSLKQIEFADGTFLGRGKHRIVLEEMTG